MKKYTQPTVEITAFDFEDIICDSSSMAAGVSSATVEEFKSNVATDVVVVEW